MNIYIVQKGNKKNNYRYTIYRLGSLAKDANIALLQLFKINIHCLCGISQQNEDENSEKCPAGELKVKRIDSSIYTDDIIHDKNILSKLNRELKHKLILLLYTQWRNNIDNVECSYHLFMGIDLKYTRILKKSFLAIITGNFDRIEYITQLEKAIIIPEIGDFFIIYEKCGEEIKKFYVKKIERELESRLEQKFEDDLNLTPKQIERARQIIDSINSQEWRNGVFSRLIDDNGIPIPIEKNEVKQMVENSHIRVHILDPDTIIWLRYSKTSDILINRLREENKLSDILEVKNGKLVVKRINKVEIVQELLRILRQNYGLPIFPSARGVIGSRKGGFIDLVREIIGQNNEITRDELKNKLHDALEPFIKRVLDPDDKSQNLQKDVADLIEIVLDVLKNNKIIYENNDRIGLT